MVHPKTALIGFHDNFNGNLTKRALEHNGYAVTSAATPESMLELSQTGNYYLHLMDLNLGHLGSSDVSPALRVYQALERRIETQSAAFHGFSANDDAVRRGMEHKIPSHDKSELIAVIKKYI